MTTGNNHCKRCGRILSIFDIDVCKMCAEQMNKPYLIKETPNPIECKALEQIRAEIEQIDIFMGGADYPFIPKKLVLYIIDKYRSIK